MKGKEIFLHARDKVIGHEIKQEVFPRPGKPPAERKKK
jgi:hypothetical protein